MKRYISKVYSSHEFTAVKYAYVELDDELHKLLESVMPKVADLNKVQGLMFLRVEFLNYAPTFIEGLPDAFEELERKLFSEELVELPEDFEVPDWEEWMCRIDFSTIQIEDDCFRWTCRVKHAVDKSETVNFNFKHVGWPELDVTKAASEED